jgi:hypothetical protein
MCDKDKGEEKGKNECYKNICKYQNFILILRLEFKNGKTEKLRTHFKSKSSQGGCNLPNEKNFKIAYKKLIHGWKMSQKSEGSKEVNRIANVNTQIIHNRNKNGNGDSGCGNGGCTLPGADIQECGCCKTNNAGNCEEGECEYC